MLLPILSGLIVSIDAFFIGLSLGLQKKCKFLYLVIINTFLLGLCLIGFFIAGRLYELIPLDPDLVVGFAFISLGLWTIVQYFISKRAKQRKHADTSLKTFVAVGFVMSVEAMLITMGITFIFQPESNLTIPLVVALAHFGYSVLSFRLARTNFAEKMPLALSHIVSGLALIIYGTMTLFVDLGGLLV